MDNLDEPYSLIEVIHVFQNDQVEAKTVFGLK